VTSVIWLAVAIWGTVTAVIVVLIAINAVADARDRRRQRRRRRNVVLLPDRNRERRQGLRGKHVREQ
jgi:hypothetical protein